jgi:hypothetical protein
MPGGLGSGPSSECTRDTLIIRQPHRLRIHLVLDEPHEIIDGLSKFRDVFLRYLMLGVVLLLSSPVHDIVPHQDANYPRLQISPVLGELRLWNYALAGLARG